MQIIETSSEVATYEIKAHVEEQKRCKDQEQERETETTASTSFFLSSTSFYFLLV